MASSSMRVYNRPTTTRQPIVLSDGAYYVPCGNGRLVVQTLSWENVVENAFYCGMNEGAAIANDGTSVKFNPALVYVTLLLMCSLLVL